MKKSSVFSLRSSVHLLLFCLLALPVALFAADAASLSPDQLPSAIVAFMAKYGGILAGVMYLTRWIVRFTPSDQDNKWWNLINFVIGAIGAHSGDADRGLNPNAAPSTLNPPPSTNFTSGTSPNLLPLLLLLGGLSVLAVASPSFAADGAGGTAPSNATVTAAVPANVTSPSWLTALANAALEYCTTNHNFVPTSGPGGTVNNLRQAKVSAVVAESLTVWELRSPQSAVPSPQTQDSGLRTQDYALKLDAAHATCIGDGKTHEGLGLDLRFIGQLPPSWKLHLPVLGKLGTFHTLAGIAPDLDQAIKGRFDERSTVCWFGFGLGGE